MVQVRFALSSSPVFSRTDTVTDSERFYNTVLDLFDLADEREEISDLLTWWNRYVMVPNAPSAVAQSSYLSRYHDRQIFPSYSAARPSIDKDSPLARIKAKRSALRTVTLNE
jgi:hypothetical protein